MQFQENPKEKEFLVREVSQGKEVAQERNFFLNFFLDFFNTEGGFFFEFFGTCASSLFEFFWEYGKNPKKEVSRERNFLKGVNFSFPF